MWATANRYGILPENRGGLMQASIFSDFNSQKTLQTTYGFSGAALLTPKQNDILVDELYFSLKWKKIRLDLGMKHPKEEFNGVSAQNGNIVYSGNTRTLPGYNLNTDFIYLHKTFAFKFNWADYTMIDHRFVHRPRLHNKSLYLKITPISRLNVIVGLEHWAQWAGKSPIYGKQPSSWRDYFRIATGQSGGTGSTVSDSINALGNHVGRRYFRINFCATSFQLSCYYDNLLEDGLPNHLHSLPDGTYGLYYGNQRKTSWISDIIYELTYTKYQSGRYHDRPATPEEMEKQDPNDHYYGKIVLGGNDNYFNNSEYRSGWTYYGRIIGTPFITPKAPNADGITLGTYNNRVVAHYLGVKGYIAQKVPYQLRLSYSLNYGTYGVPLKHSPGQCSFGLEAGILRKTKLPFLIDVGIYGDYGKLYDKNFGASVRISRNGTIR
ncbi:MAG: capsule assembly Wzi family protein [Odoribacter sp.]|nr:capsule assembly Wzi family protein [Odoribacter sp.]